MIEIFTVSRMRIEGGHRIDDPEINASEEFEDAR